MALITKTVGPQRESFDLSRIPAHQQITQDMVDTAPEFVPIYLKSVPFTMTSVPNMFAFYSAVRFAAESGVPGDVVECGVWRGGSCMIAALTLAALEPRSERKIWLYDTFAGMSAPTAVDQPIGFGRSAVQEAPMDTWQKLQVEDGRNEWCYASLADVKRNLSGTGFPGDRTVYVEGKVEETIPARVPAAISCLRLDTDWYESTYHELTHLYPLLSPGGMLLLDDYGFWAGQKQAVDQYCREQGIQLFLQRIDSNSRLAIKPR